MHNEFQDKKTFAFSVPALFHMAASFYNNIKIAISWMVSSGQRNQLGLEQRHS